MADKKEYFINGIQQIGLGVNDIYSCWQWYIDNFNFDLPIFDEEAEAKIMLPYTEGLPRRRHAALVLNYQGGGGLEIWKHTSFESRPSIHSLKPGDLGIWASIIKVKDIDNSLAFLKSKGVSIKSGIHTLVGTKYFYIQDLNGHVIKVEESDNWFKTKDWHSGGIGGCILGVSNMDASIAFYKNVLGYDVLLSDETGHDPAFTEMGYPQQTYRKVRLTHSKKRAGSFSNLLGKTYIELLELQSDIPNKIFENRMWGELGYIHLCFDVNNMENLKEYSASVGHPFTVDSGESFDMGEAAGRFAYTEDPDGTLIEFVETHKIPIFKKMGWYYDLQKKPMQQPLPNYLLWAMSLTRVKKVGK